jgi:hypothetical protein
MIAMQAKYERQLWQQEELGMILQAAATVKKPLPLARRAAQELSQSVLDSHFR